MIFQEIESYGLFFTLKKGYTPETSVLIDIFDTFDNFLFLEISQLNFYYQVSRITNDFSESTILIKSLFCFSL